MKLVRYDAVRRALDAALTVDEVLHVRDEAERLQLYARQAKDRDNIAKAVELRSLAERRLGELIRTQKNTVGLARGGWPTRGPEAGPQVTLADAGISKNLSSRAQQLAALDEPAFAAVLKHQRDRIMSGGLVALAAVGGDADVLTEAKEIRSERADRKRAVRDARLIELSGFDAPLPDRRFNVILADPPWRYDFSPSDDRSVENHFPTMPLEEILALPVESLATPDAMLFLWAPPAFLHKAIEVMTAWGFAMASGMVWIKPSMGTGIYVRQRHENLLLGKRGDPITPRPGTQPDSVIEAPRGPHSEKPEQVYEVIECLYPNLSKIELFARTRRTGWTSWGNEA
jgi:N6-adenosine-specific RNA methylase IME4